MTAAPDGVERDYPLQRLTTIRTGGAADWFARAGSSEQLAELLDAAGCRGLRVGGASFSEKHANFVENHGDATTADVIALMAEGRRRVKERFGVELEPEVQALGPVTFPEDWGPR